MISTFSRHPSRYPSNYPKTLSSGQGAYVWDGVKNYIDWSQGLSSVGVLGHAHPDIVAACSLSISHGTSFHVNHSLEPEVSSLLCSVLPPYAEEVRWCMNGTDATAGAIRLARAHTHRDRIVAFTGSYHGDSTTDWHISGKSPARGIPKQTVKPLQTEFNNVYGLRKLFSLFSYDIAAIILEVGAEEPTAEFVQALHELRDTHKCFLIIDEVVTGFRLAVGGATELYGFRPDLCTFGKTLGSGIPVASLVGRKDIMSGFDPSHSKGPVFMSFTHAANPLSLTAAKTTIDCLKDGEKIEQASDAGRVFLRHFRQSCDRHSIPASVLGQPPRFTLQFEKHSLSQFQSFMVQYGVLIGFTNCPTCLHGHSGVMDQTLEGVDQCLKKLSVTRPQSEKKTFAVRSTTAA